MELTEHLAELRTHLIRSIWYLVVGAVVAYNLFAPIYHLLYRPLEKEITKLNEARIQKEVALQVKNAPAQLRPDILIIPHATHNPPTQEEFNRLADAVEWIRKHPVATPLMSSIFRGFTEPFLVQLKISMVVGVIVVLPAIMWEFAQFVLPALTPKEKKPLKFLVPLSIILVIFGVIVAYVTMFFAVGWFLTFLDNYPQPAILMQDPNEYILFLLKMMAAFAISFQLPVVLMALAYAGLVTSDGLWKQWRWGLVIAALGMVFTPANDPWSLALIAIALLILYFGSIILVKFVEKARNKQSVA